MDIYMVVDMFNYGQLHRPQAQTVIFKDTGVLTYVADLI